ncbi:DUF6685 family protein [Leptotrichia sp. oral taxon 879]|uniref:DUF6685 family protein n=1 Tax=Leptotrichia sp. oral taxon 879 TaxID=1227267 RepID=UPI0003AD8BBE|nr:DUF6685 family protein [Leptotrichia sp. oral taxon 879]ERK49051.1 hypothetical protein HMPREF1552_01848 [Leptotrichia sp. oral taxon 879 str. F0557]
MNMKGFIDKIKFKNKSVSEKVENFIKENDKKLRQEIEKLDSIISENYDIMTGIGEKEYLWDILNYNYENIKDKKEKEDNGILGYIDNTEDFNLNVYLEKLDKKSTEKISSLNFDIRDVNSINSCSIYLKGIGNSQEVIFSSKVLGKISLDDYIENNGTLLHFLELEKEFKQFSKDIQGKIKLFSKEILENLNDGEVSSIIEIFKKHPENGLSDIFKGKRNIKISFVPYNQEIRWHNKGASHHFSLIRYLLKKRPAVETFIFKSDLSKFTLDYLENNTIKKLFNDDEIFLLPYNNELLNILRSVPKLKIRNYTKIRIKYPYKLENGQKIDDIDDNGDKIKRFNFSFVVLLKEEESHRNLIKVLKENNFYDLKKYYNKYLKEQNKNLKSYIAKNWITKEEIEKIDGLKLF